MNGTTDYRLSPMNDNDKKAYEERLRRRLIILKDEMEAGQFHFPAESLLAKELPEVRMGPDGLVDLTTVGSSVRAAALANEFMVERQEAKSISLAWVQTEYFALLEDLFREYIRAMRDHEATPHQIALSVQSNEAMCNEVIRSLDAVAKTFRDFWSKYEFVVETHLDDMSGTKAVYGGDILPHHESNTIACAAVISDRIVLPDPIDRITSHLRPALHEREVVYQFVKHGLSMFALKELVFADLPSPILTVCEGIFTGGDEFIQRWAAKAADEDTLFHLNTALGSEYSSLEEVTEYLNRVGGDRALDSKLPAADRLVGDVEFTGSIVERVEQLQEFRRDKLAVPFSELFGNTIVMDTFGRMMQTNVVLSHCTRFHGVPLIDAPTSWQWLRWKFEYDSARGLGAESRIIDIASANALTSSFQRESKYLARLSPAGVVAVRQAGLLDVLRDRLREGVRELQESSGDVFEAISHRVLANLESAFDEYERQLQELVSAKTDLGSKQIPLLLGTAAFALSGPITGNYALSLVAAASGLLGGANLKDLWKTGRKLVSEGTALARTPIGLLVRPH